jgi:hypothetical protein
MLAETERLLDNQRFRRRRRYLCVQVDGTRYPARLRDKPDVGATLDIGFPVVVTDATDAAGGGPVLADRVHGRRP